MGRVDQIEADSRGGRAVVPAQFLLLAVYLIGSFGVLLAAALHTGDPAAVLDPTLERLGDPKDSLPPVGADSVWNPLTWVFGISRVVAFFVYPLALITIVFGLASLIRTWRIGDRGTFSWLVLGTGL